DLAPQRSWRHLDTLQFTTTIHASLPRSKCEACGVLTIAAPWADKHSRFTLLFECMVIEVVQACSNVSAAAALLGLNWKTVHSIMDRAVQRGLKLREFEQINHVGIDEKNFLAKDKTTFRLWSTSTTSEYWKFNLGVQGNRSIIYGKH
ncbi:MAG: transposase family protein, partial [Pirellula sp.]|nr:transposase family protein [Pirellula sp.]